MSTEGDAAEPDPPRADGEVAEATRRVFAALVPPPEVRLAVAGRAEALGLPGRPVPAANLHLTLRFAGDLDPVAIDRWMAELDVAELGPSFRIGLAALGAFPRKRRATVAWVGIGRGRDAVTDLVGVVEASAVEAGLGEEERPFRAHLSIARIRPPVDLRRVECPGFEDIAWRAGEVTLLASELGRDGARYEVVETFPLG